MSLEIANLDVSIEGIGILHEVNLSVPQGQMAEIGRAHV